ncbi:MAG: hypothetical protein LBS45_09480 [Synergistaceae bacterium]|jgi:hypothetical protein|nr:hypothetical protein [Synergistaceae bacterium]
MKQFVRVLVFAAIVLCIIASVSVEVSAGTKVFGMFVVDLPDGWEGSVRAPDDVLFVNTSLPFNPMQVMFYERGSTSSFNSFVDALSDQLGEDPMKRTSSSASWRENYKNDRGVTTFWQAQRHLPRGYITIVMSSFQLDGAMAASQRALARSINLR